LKDELAICMDAIEADTWEAVEDVKIKVFRNVNIAKEVADLLYFIQMPTLQGMFAYIQHTLMWKRPSDGPRRFETTSPSSQSSIISGMSEPPRKAAQRQARTKRPCRSQGQRARVQKATRESSSRRSPRLRQMTGKAQAES
jgi:hypothetical protein